MEFHILIKIFNIFAYSGSGIETETSRPITSIVKKRIEYCNYLKFSYGTPKRLKSSFHYSTLSEVSRCSVSLNSYMHLNFFSNERKTFFLNILNFCKPCRYTYNLILFEQ